MSRRNWISVFSLTLAFAVGWAFTNRPAPALAEVTTPHGKCVGIHAVYQPTGRTNVYRAFEDGTVELTTGTIGNDYTKWQGAGR
jgi:hypothetical protein